MRSRRSFERRLRRALLVFSIVPTLLLLGVGTYVVSRAFTLSDSIEAWDRVARSGGDLIERAEKSGDPELARAARAHRDELGPSVMQARRWEYILDRGIWAVVVAAVLAGTALAVLAQRASRRMGRRLSRPLEELAGWARMVARGEPLPPPQPNEAEKSEFGVLRVAFRSMQDELDAGRARELEQERMRTWIGMARRVAHELKNPLTPMKLAVRTLQRGAPADEPSQEALEVIAAESARLEELARAFAQFGRLPEGPPAEVDLREMLEYLLRTHLPPEVQPRLRVPLQLPSVHGHPDALSRAFANLLLNAADAVSGGGSVEVIARAANGHVEVRVLDSGPGIEPEILERIWEPDFTTKSRGTGLGLALVRQTVQAHGGQVVARNRPEGGAEFRVILPISPSSSEVVTSGR
jgi:two-component system nitrogen regulation sensor histidine kinase NtrY